jgi:hypothetical protein
MVIFGLLNPVTFLGSKLDQCQTCGLVGNHLLVRKTYWGHLFWVPVVLLGFKHGMACANCGAWTGIPMLQMRNGMRNQSLPLARVRPDLERMRTQIFDETYRRPTEAELFDRVGVNPRRGAFDLYFKLWPVLVVGLVVLAVIAVLA